MEDEQQVSAAMKQRAQNRDDHRSQPFILLLYPFFFMSLSCLGIEIAKQTDKLRKLKLFLAGPSTTNAERRKPRLVFIGTLV